MPATFTVDGVVSSRLNKRMAELGMCSRREADDWVAQGWVKVNGKVAEMGMQVLPSVVMLGFMWKMYKDVRINIAIIAGSVAAFALALWLVRSQATVDDVSYMKAMIPHHSIAIMTSERAHIRDPRVRELADGIIEAQLREIAEMKKLIAELQKNSTPSGAPDLPAPPVQ